MCPNTTKTKENQNKGRTKTIFFARGNACGALNDKNTSNHTVWEKAKKNTAGYSEDQIIRAVQLTKAAIKPYAEPLVPTGVVRSTE